MPLTSSRGVSGSNQNGKESGSFNNTGRWKVIANTGAAIELVEPTTNVTVVLVGCFHGSTASAVDVQTVLESTLPDAVALELCASRFTSLTQPASHGTNKAETAEPETTGNLSPNDKTPLMKKPQTTTLPQVSPPPSHQRLQRHVHMILSLVQSRGIAVGVVAVILTATTAFQSVLFRLQPGLEFQTAIDFCHGVNNNYSTNGNSHNKRNHSIIDIVLVDQNVQVTLRRLSDIPKVSWSLGSDFLRECRSQQDVIAAYNHTYGVEHMGLQMAVLGSPSTSSSRLPTTVSLGAFLTRSRAAVVDWLKWLFVATGTMTALETLSTVSLDDSRDTTAVAIESAVAAVTLAHADSANLDSGLDGTTMAILVSNAMLITGIYHLLVLPASRVVLRERDDFLTQGIRHACQLARDSNTTAFEPLLSSCDKKVVVAVLGLLHVNGVAQRLLTPPHTTMDRFIQPETPTNRAGRQMKC